MDIPSTLPVNGDEKVQTLFNVKDRRFLFLILLVAFLVGLRGIFHYGYIGQDFPAHRSIILGFPDSFSFRGTNPVGLYWLGSFIRQHITSAYYLETTAFVLLLLNLAALWYAYVLTWKTLSTQSLRFAAAALITFVPFRVVHSIVIAGDAFSVPFFIFAAILTLRLFEDPEALINWVGLSLTLTISLLCKYTFCGILPPLGLIMLAAILPRIPARKWLRWLTVAGLSLALPSGLFLYEMHESQKVDSYTTTTHWLPPEAPSVMRWRDILLPQASDVGLLSAPQYFRDRLYENRKYSYIGLVHIATFTDCLNYFQPPPQEIRTDWSARQQDDFQRKRGFYSRVVQRLSVRGSLPYTLMAITGTILCLLLSIPAILNRSTLIPKPAGLLCLLAVGFYSPILLSLPRIAEPYLAGYWLPRLIMPSLLVFLLLGFVLLEAMGARIDLIGKRIKTINLVVLVYTTVICVIFICFLSSPWTNSL